MSSLYQQPERKRAHPGMGVTSPGRRGVECGRPRPPESQQIWFRWRRRISNGWEDGSANLRIRRGEGGLLRRAFPPQRIGYPRSRGVNASPDGEIPPKVRQMARDQAFEIPRRLTVRRSGRRIAWRSLFVCLHQFRDAPVQFRALHLSCSAKRVKDTHDLADKITRNSGCGSGA